MKTFCNGLRIEHTDNEYAIYRELDVNTSNRGDIVAVGFGVEEPLAKALAIAKQMYLEPYKGRR